MLTRYILKTYLWFLFLSTAISYLVFLLGDLLSNFSTFFLSKKQSLFQSILLHYLAELPKTLTLLSPFIIIASTFFAILWFEKRRELHILYSSGISPLSLLFPLWMGSALFTLFLFFNIEWVIPHWPFRSPIRERSRKLYPAPLKDQQNRLFFCQVYYADTEEILGKHNSMGLLILEEDAFWVAKKGRWNRKKQLWELTHTWHYRRGQWKFFPKLEWKTNIHPDDLESVSSLRSDFLGVISLWKKYKRRKLPLLELKFYQSLLFYFRPFLFVLLIFLAFTEPHWGLGKSLLVAASLLVFFEIFSYLLSALSKGSLFPPLWATFFPYCFTFLLGLEWLAQREQKSPLGE